MLDKDLLGLLGGNRKYIAYSVLAMIVGLLANLGITACICYAVRLAADGAGAAEYIAPAAIASVCIALRFCITKLTNEFKNTLGAHVKKDLRARAYDKMLRLGVRSSEKATMAGMTQVGVEGIEQLDLYYSTYLPQFFYSMIAPFILFAICVPLDWRTAVMLIVCVPLIPVSIVAVSKYAKKIFAKYWGKYTSMGDIFLDSVQGLKELKIFKADARKHAQINESAEEFRKITMKVLVMQLASTTIMDLVAYGGAGAGIALAVYGVTQGGDPFSALFLVLVAVEFFLPLRSLGSAFHVAMNGASAGRKILEILEAKEPQWGDGEVSDPSIELLGVTFSYDGKRDVLEDVTMSFPRTGFTAIVGESGCGKSTFLKLLLRFWEKEKGSISYNGIDVDNIDSDNLFDNVTMVSQTTYLFDESIEENLRIAKPGASREEIERACKRASVHDFIMSLPEGYKTQAGAMGDNLSAGEKQRIGLARAFLKGSQLILLDEPTSNVDSINEGMILKSLAEQKSKKSIILVSHRESTMAIADRIYKVENGVMTEGR